MSNLSLLKNKITSQNYRHWKLCKMDHVV